LSRAVSCCKNDEAVFQQTLRGEEEREFYRLAMDKSRALARDFTTKDYDWGIRRIMEIRRTMNQKRSALSRLRVVPIYLTVNLRGNAWAD